MKKIQDINAAMLVVDNRGRFLFLLRRDNNIWDLPGGTVEWGEHPLLTAIRETKEETGLQVKKAKLHTATSATYEKNGILKHALYFVYRAQSWSGKVTLSSEHKEHCWFSKTDIKKTPSIGLNARDAVLQKSSHV